jgi:hypothetical protein
VAYRLGINAINLGDASESPFLKEGYLGGFSNGDKKSPSPPFPMGGI